MGMSYHFLNKNKKSIEYHHNAACFMRADYEYNDLDGRAKYFKFMFPTYKKPEKKEVSKEYILSIKEIHDFGQYMDEIDWKEGSITFDLTSVPGHRIFAICTCIRMLQEYGASIFTAWQILSNPKFFKPLSAIEKFVLMHPLSACLGGDEHHLYQTSQMRGKCEEFISYKPDFRKQNSYDRGDGGMPPPKGFDLPFSQHPHFRSISLFVSYSPPAYNVGDNSFIKYLKEKALSKTPLEKLYAWNKDALLLSAIKELP